MIKKARPIYNGQKWDAIYVSHKVRANLPKKGPWNGCRAHHAHQFLVYKLVLQCDWPTNDSGMTWLSFGPKSFTMSAWVVCPSNCLHGIEWINCIACGPNIPPPTLVGRTICLIGPTMNGPLNFFPFFSFFWSKSLSNNPDPQTDCLRMVGGACSAVGLSATGGPTAEK